MDFETKSFVFHIPLPDRLQRQSSRKTKEMEEYDLTDKAIDLFMEKVEGREVDFSSISTYDRGLGSVVKGERSEEEARALEEFSDGPLGLMDAKMIRFWKKHITVTAKVEVVNKTAIDEEEAIKRNYGYGTGRNTGD